VTWPMWNLVLVHLEIVLILTQDWCIIYANIPLAQKLFWTHLMEHRGDVGHVKSRFGPFGDGVSVNAR
jgi:hypothetical protein